MKRTRSHTPSWASYARLVLACVMGLLALLLITGGPDENLQAVAAQNTVGQVEDASEAEAAIIYSPQGLSTVPAGWTDSPTFTITWDDPALMKNSKAITGARYTIDISPTNDYSGELASNLVTISETMRISDVTLPDTVDGLHDIWVWLVAEDGTLDVTKAASTTYRYDATPPTVVITAPEYLTVTSPVSDTSFEVSWQGYDLSPLTYTVDYRDTKWVTWTNWISPGTITQSEFVSGMIGHSYVFSVTAENRVGLTADATVTTTVQISESIEPVSTTIFLPLVLRFYPPLANGGFESGALAPGWLPTKGGFTVDEIDRGAGLSVSVETSVVTESESMTGPVYEGQYSALLGNTHGENGQLPVGYGGIVQEIPLPEGASKMRFAYRIVTNDLVEGADDLYYDTFEVSINEAPGVVSDTARVAKCAEASLNPTGVISATEGLVLCGGRYGSPSDLGDLWDSGWLSVTLDTSALTGTVKLYFTVWGREYEEIYYNDEGWYNTWAYVDDIVLED